MPVLLVDSADYHPSKGIIFLGRCPREIIHSQGDNLHYPPTSQAITVYYYPEDIHIMKDTVDRQIMPTGSRKLPVPGKKVIVIILNTKKVIYKKKAR